MKKKKTGENYLDKIPCRTDTIKWEMDEKGNIVLILTNKGFFHGIARILFHRPRISKIHLDEMGNFIWPLLDGTRSVYEIGRLVEERFQDKAKPLYERLVQYLELLREYGFITFDNCGFHV